MTMSYKTSEMGKPQFVREVYERCRGNRDKAREILKCSESVLCKRLRTAGAHYLAASAVSCVVASSAAGTPLAGILLAILYAFVNKWLNGAFKEPVCIMREEFVWCQTLEEASDVYRSMGGDPDDMPTAEGIRKGVASLEAETGKHVRTYPTDFFDPPPTMWEDELHRLSMLVTAKTVVSILLYIGAAAELVCLLINNNH